uniref:hypothetical protein n=1 Tax=Alistipes sp. TaxID=1872444 RepID=UPI004056730F
MKHIFLLLMVGLTLPGVAQKIQNHYIVREEAEATIHHTMPVTLFENREEGEFTFDITWCDHEGKEDPEAVINFTYHSQEPQPADSLLIEGQFTAILRCCEKLYIEPDKEGWKHRYTLSVPIEELLRLYDEASPTITLYAPKREILYIPKRKAWSHYRPIGQRIFQTIALNRK